MLSRAKVFLDTSVLFAAVQSETGAARLILKLGEAGAIVLYIGPGVLDEMDGVLERKSPESKPYFALLLDKSRVQIGSSADEETVYYANSITQYLPDAKVLAEALANRVDYFVSFDRKHFVENPQTEVLPFPVGTPGDFLQWYHESILTDQEK